MNDENMEAARTAIWVELTKERTEGLENHFGEFKERLRHEDPERARIVAICYTKMQEIRGLVELYL